MKKIMLFILVAFLLISFTSAQQDSLGVFTKGTDINLIQVCSSCTYNNITTIKTANGTLFTFNEVMDKDGTFFNWTLILNYTDSSGEYKINGIGDLDGVATIWTYSIIVTYKGDVLSSSQSILYIGLFVIMLFVFFMVIFFIGKLPESNTKDEEGRLLSISYLKYVRSILWFVEWMIFIAMIYLSSNLAFAYLGEELFAQILFTFFRICFGVTPLIVTVWIIWIFVNMFHDKQLQNLLNRGFFEQGRLP